MNSAKKEVFSHTLFIVFKVLMYHVVEGKIYSKDLKNGMTLPSVEGTPIRINIYNVRKHEDPRVTLLDK